jgi:hypothetical protein
MVDERKVKKTENINKRRTRRRRRRIRRRKRGLRSNLFIYL